MKHIGIFNTSGDVQTALDNETFENPYVAKVNGTLDYNTLQPVQPCYLGEWSDDGQGHYTFQILDNSGFEDVVNIGSLMGVYYGDDPINMDVKLNFDGFSWRMELYVPEESNTPQHAFDEISDYWNSEVLVDPSDTASSVNVNWDGVDTFTFNQDGLIINTINPECSEASE